MQRLRPVLAALVFFCVTAALAQEPARPSQVGLSPDWPSYLGPHNNLSAAPCTDALVEKFADAKLVWLSDVPIPNGMAGDDRNPGRDGPDFVSGGYASPVLAEGKVYLQYYVPSGQVAEESVKKHGEQFKAKFLVEADDVIHCFDAATGKTLWKQVFPKLSLNLQGFTKGGPSLTCCVAGGKVYAHFTGGWLYCLDAKSGEKLWTYKTDRFDYQEKLRRAAIEKKRLVAYNRDFKTSPAVVDGVVLFNDHRSHKVIAPGGPGWEFHYEPASNLIALDAETGKELWRKPNGLSGGAQPVGWASGGKWYLLASGGDKQVRCLEPRTGQERWKVECPDGLPPALDGDLMVSGGGADKKENFHVGYRISEKGAEKLWELKSHGRPGLAWPAAANGHMYVESDPRGKLLCIALATGKVVGEAPAAKEPHFGYFPRVLGSRVLCGGADTNQLHLYSSDPKAFRLLDDAPIPNAWGYEMPMMPACAEGRFYFRTHNRLVCVDLRKDAKEGRPFRVADLTPAGSQPAPAAGKSGAPERGAPVPPGGDLRDE